MGEHFPAIAGTLGVVVLAFALIGLGWRNRLRRQAAIPKPYPVVADEYCFDSEGQYVSTTRGEDWLDRIAVHQLGIRCEAVLRLGEHGVLIARASMNDVYLPYAALTRVTRSSGMAGKFVEKDGLLVIGWVKDGFEFDTGFRPRYHQDLEKIHNGLTHRLNGGAQHEGTAQ